MSCFICKEKTIKVCDGVCVVSGLDAGDNCEDCPGLPKERTPYKYKAGWDSNDFNDAT